MTTQSLLLAALLAAPTLAQNQDAGRGLSAGGGQASLGTSTLFAGLQHDPLGNASLAPGANDSLVVSNLGSSGQDGVRVALGEAQSHRLMFQPPPVGGLPVGAFLSLTTEGVLSGVPSQEIWTVRTEVLPGNNLFGMSLDTTNVGTGVFRIEARLDGTTVTNVTLPPLTSLAPTLDQPHPTTAGS